MPKGATKLVSMKLDPKKIEERNKPSSVITDDAPAYPYGLRVNLDEDSLDALGVSTLPKVGSTMYLGANVKVVSVSDNEHTSEGGETHRHRSVELQITEMGLDGERAKEEPQTETALYGAAPNQNQPGLAGLK